TGGRAWLFPRGMFHPATSLHNHAGNELTLDYPAAPQRLQAMIWLPMQNAALSPCRRRAGRHRSRRGGDLVRSRRVELNDQPFARLLDTDFIFRNQGREKRGSLLAERPWQNRQAVN